MATEYWVAQIGPTGEIDLEVAYGLEYGDLTREGAQKIVDEWRTPRGENGPVVVRREVTDWTQCDNDQEDK